jgi:hypothetical protein
MMAMMMAMMMATMMATMMAIRMVMRLGMQAAHVLSGRRKEQVPQLSVSRLQRN